MRASLVAVALLLIAGCTIEPSSLGAITAGAAAKAAIAEVRSTTEVKVVSTSLSTYREAAPDGAAVPGATLVWAVILSGTFQPPSCGPATATPHPCPSPATTALVLLDARTGDFIEATMPAPSRSP